MVVKRQGNGARRVVREIDFNGHEAGNGGDYDNGEISKDGSESADTVAKQAISITQGFALPLARRLHAGV